MLYHIRYLGFLLNVSLIKIILGKGIRIALLFGFAWHPAKLAAVRLRICVQILSHVQTSEVTTALLELDATFGTKKDVFGNLT